ncbi:7101_t:CDS:1 [Rhizophagus irregularis]|nr:7101_t:CDS:1 [Rhizophagus irregularis]
MKKLPQQIIDIPELYCLLINFIPTSLTYLFKAAKISKDITKKILLKFLFDLHKDIYESIWKLRAIAWKQFKKDHEITKKSFTNYRRNHHHDSTRRLRQSEFNNINNINGYRCPLNDTRRQIKNHTLWIYLTSSNFLHNLPWLSSLNDDLSSFHLHIFNNTLFLI